MIKVSVYLQAGESQAVSYYRFMQYFKTMRMNVTYNLMIPDNKASSFLPIAKKNLIKKFYIFIYILLRVQVQLLYDIVRKPEYIIISRRLIQRILPWSYILSLYIIKFRGVKIIWDFDDQIVYLREVTSRGFSILSRISDSIIVGSPLLKEMIQENLKHKVHILPTTDGDMYTLFSEEVMNQRLSSFEDEIKFVWVGTFPGLRYLSPLMPALEILGENLCKRGKKTKLTVVCNYPLSYYPLHFKIDNVNWTRNIAIEKMLESHVGIMPLEDNEETRGKCSFKLIQYMSIGLPVIASAVGMNKIVVKERFGYAPNSLDVIQWSKSMINVVDDKKKWVVRSKEAIKEWKNNYGYQTNLNKWKHLLNLS